MSDEQKNPGERSVSPAEALTRARAIMDEVPVASAVLDARVLALLVLVESAPDHPAGRGYDEKGLTVSTIRDELGVSQATASEMASAAERLGLVIPVPVDDHRVSAWALTAKGKRLRMQRRGST